MTVYGWEDQKKTQKTHERKQKRTIEGGGEQAGRLEKNESDCLF